MLWSFKFVCVKLKKKTLTCNTNYKQYSCIFQKKKNAPSSPYLTGIWNKNRPVSRVLSSTLLQVCRSYHLSSLSVTGKIKQPTLRIERAALTLRFIWSFNSPGLPEPTVTNWLRELLPHVFTITRHCCRAVILCGTCYLLLPGFFPLGSGMLCVARTFLSAFTER